MNKCILYLNRVFIKVTHLIKKKLLTNCHVCKLQSRPTPTGSQETLKVKEENLKRHSNPEMLGN